MGQHSERCRRSSVGWQELIRFNGRDYQVEEQVRRKELGQAS
jgi:hypothetical protein